MWAELVSFSLLLYCVNNVIMIIELVLSFIISHTAYQILLIYIPECYPTYMRTTAGGMALGIGRFGAAVGALVAEYLDESSIVYTLYTFIGVMLVNAVGTLFLRTETYDTLLADNRSRSGRSYGTMDTVEPHSIPPLLDSASG